MAGLFPAIAMQLLGFVALYGLILIPMGGVVFADFWILPRLGLAPWWAERSGSRLHPGAALAWGGTLLASLLVVGFGGLQIFFASIPAWGLAIVLYVVSSAILQRRVASEDEG